MWVWKHPNWPNFHFDADLFSTKINSFHRTAERMFGRVEALSSVQHTDAMIDLMVSEAIKTSAIEGEILDRESVRSSIRAHLGYENKSSQLDARVEGIAALMTSVQQHWNRPLTSELLCEWQSSVIVNSPRSNIKHSIRGGSYRTEAVDIISGPIGREKIHYSTPPADQLSSEMNRFFDWYNSNPPELSGPVKAGIAHAWFELIHPFEDGNGRFGRAIADHALSQGLGFPTLASLASAIEERRKDYYRELGALGRGDLSLNGWLEFFTSICVEAQEITKQQLDFVLGKTRFYEAFESILNERQKRVVKRIFAEGSKGFKGGITTKKYSTIAKCPLRTASRDLAALSNQDVVVKMPEGGRSTRYELSIPPPRV